MSCNVGHNCLTRLGYNALKVSGYRTSNHLTDGVHKANRLLDLDLFPSITQQHGRCIHSGSKDERGNWSNSSHEHSSSRYHQQFHRRTYERKRNSAHDRNEDQQNQQTNIHNSEPNISHYQRLNVGHEADLNTIKSAYYSLSKLYHPDVVGLDNQKASENFRLITESYDTLSDPKLRDEYDRQLNLAQSSQSNSDNLSWQPNGSGSSNNQNPAFHRANADLIFRLKNELAFEQEKRKNPKKFRAGSFRQGEEEEGGMLATESKIRTLDRQLSSLDLGINKDGSDFYRMHFRETIRRRREGLASDTHKMTKSNRAEGDLGPLVAILVAAIAVLYAGINTFFDIDLAASLDAKLKKLQQDELPPD